MTLSFVRVLFLCMSGVVGYYVGTLLLDPVLGAEWGLLCGLVMIFVESRLKRVSVSGLSSMVFGLLLGFFMAKLLSDIILLMPLGIFFHSVSRVVLTLVFSYLGAVMALRGKDEFNIIIPYMRFRRQDVKDEVILVDTSAIIDGRIQEIYKTKFLGGRLVVPRCVLGELQKISDSSDELKRRRGRRAVELLHKMQEDPQVDIQIHEDELRDIQGVDAKLIKLANLMDARLCTTDFNLGRVAALQGVEVLNINDLARAVKPAIFVGDEMEVSLVSRGKEANQALAYMPDGTLVVVSDAHQLIGKSVIVTVTSVLQTQAGKMVFAKLKG